MKPNGKSHIASDYDENVMFFRDVSLGPHETQLRFRLIHFWEAWNPIKKTLIGLEMLLIDEQGTVIQGFISPGRIQKYLPKMKRGSIYKLNNFYGSSNKSMYRVSAHAVTVSFSWNSELSVLLDSTTPFDEDRFRFHSHEEFEANCDLKGDLYVLALTSMSSSRVFMDNDVQPTVDYLACLGAHISFSPQRVFECTATIDDVVHDSPWYRAKISVYDNSEQAILYYSAMLVANRPGRRHRANETQGVNNEVPVPKL
ncbi:hypothetical protein Bca52824_013780 [Brassica carinata]|uniref:Replication protein A 70 kDa DNA-binding subunit B/D first OB fold domain-containing protein n=1 Tax=Brassica carinata TaxID=52824 RepID=A0A8X7W0A2_BRACI|nr:hypothetical protein Bca52824_013780 [Brassica carinata]